MTADPERLGLRIEEQSMCHTGLHNRAEANQQEVLLMRAQARTATCCSRWTSSSTSWSSSSRRSRRTRSHRWGNQPAPYPLQALHLHGSGCLAAYLFADAWFGWPVMPVLCLR